MTDLVAKENNNFQSGSYLGAGFGSGKKEMSFPYLKFSKFGMELVSQNEEGEKETKSLKKLTAIPLMATKQYQVSVGEKADFKVTHESNEFLNSKNCFLVDKILEKIVHPIKNMQDVRDATTDYAAEKAYKPSKRTVLYLYTKEHGVIRSYLRLTQTVGMGDDGYRFKNPIENGLEDIINKHGGTLQHNWFDITMEDNGDPGLTTYYPVFKQKAEVEDMEHREASDNAARKIMEENGQKLQKYGGNLLDDIQQENIVEATNKDDENDLPF